MYNRWQAHFMQVPDSQSYYLERKLKQVSAHMRISTMHTLKERERERVKITHITHTLRPEQCQVLP
jgi:hypothetical protein